MKTQPETVDGAILRLLALDGPAVRLIAGIDLARGFERLAMAERLLAEGLADDQEVGGSWGTSSAEHAGTMLAGSVTR